MSRRPMSLGRRGIQKQEKRRLQFCRPRLGLISALLLPARWGLGRALGGLDETPELRPQVLLPLA